MSAWLILRYLHVALALGSVTLFVARAVPVVLSGREPPPGLWRVLPHGVDTLLLFSGIGLMVLSRQYPPTVEWLTLKLVLIVVYILLGMAAFRLHRRALWLRAGLLAAALATFVWIALIALTRQPWPFTP